MSLKTLFTTLLVAFTLSANAFSIDATTTPARKGKVYDDPEIPSIYTGGTAEMNKFISNSLKYPADASELNKQGLVVYTFIVETDGTLTNFEIAHHAYPSLDEEALRILKTMPAWRPARNKGQVVRSTNYVPMYFKLNKNAGTRTAQNRTSPSQMYGKKNEEIVNSEVYSIVDVMPQYEYGERELAGFIAHNIRYPEEARKENAQGRVLCSFIVAADGSISNIEIVQGIHAELDKEAVRVLSLMPKWKPGVRDGRAVNVKCILPIDFTKNY